MQNPTRIPDLVVMVGLPRSGKTTWVHAWYRPQGYAVVCPDDVRLAMHGQRFIASAEPYVWATVYTMVDSLMRSGCPVVVDGCHGTRKRRDDWRKRGARFHVVDTPEAVCLKRARDEHDDDILPVIARMADEWEPLGSDERPVTDSGTGREDPHWQQHDAAVESQVTRDDRSL